MNPQVQAGIKRFAKGFIAGGIAQVVLIIGPGLKFSSLKEIGAIAASLAFGFIVGGLLGVEKMLNWQEPAPMIIDNYPYED